MCTGAGRTPIGAVSHLVSPHLHQRALWLASVACMNAFCLLEPVEIATMKMEWSRLKSVGPL